MTEQNTQPTASEGTFDVREALDDDVLKTPEDIAHEVWGEGTGFPPGFGPAMIDMLIAAVELAFEVRPHGTVTDALYCAHCQNDDHATYACEARGTVPAKQISDAEVDAAGRHLGMGDGMEHWIDRDSVRAALEAAWEVRSDV